MRKRKIDREREFYTYLKAVGIACYGRTYERGNWYYFFDLKNGERRYWTNPGEEMKEALKIE